MIVTASVRRGLPFFLLSLLAPLLLLAPGASQAATCDGFYPSGFKLAEGKLNPATPSLSKPAKGVRIQEPNFKTCLFRATDHRTEPSSYYLRNDYSRRQAFNANNTYFLAYSNDGTWRLYDANTLKQLRILEPAGDAEPQWHPTDPNTLYYLPTTGGTKLLKLDVRNNQSSTVVDFVGKLPSWASSAKHIWTHSEGGPSANGRYWGFVVEGGNDWNLLGYIVWDLQQNKLVGSRQASGGLDNVSISASGRWFVVSGDDGVWAWSADFSKKKLIASMGGVHSDLGIMANGDDYFISADYQSDNGDVYFVDLDTCPSVGASASSAPQCPRTVLFSMYPTGAWATLHFSAKAFSKPGWALISTYDTDSRSGSIPWFESKIFAIELKASPKIYPLAFTRRVSPNNDYGQTGADAYWTEPHGTVNRDFTRISFNSNWGNSTGADVDIYTIQLPANAFGGGTAPPAGRVPGMSGNLPPEKKGGSSAAAQSIPTASSPALPSGAGSTETVSIGCVLCVHLDQARSTMAAFADYMWRHARPLLRSAARALDFGSDHPSTPVAAMPAGSAAAMHEPVQAAASATAAIVPATDKDTTSKPTGNTTGVAPAAIAADACDAANRAKASTARRAATGNAADDACPAKSTRTL